MKVKFFLYLFICFLLSACYMPDGNLLLDYSDKTIPDYEKVEIIEGLEPYKEAEIEDVIIDGLEPEYSYSSLNLQDSMNIVQSIISFIDDGFLSALLESSNLTWDTINGSNLIPRSAVASIEFEMMNEGFDLVFDGGKTSARVNFLDLIAKGDCVKLIRFIFDKLDSYEWGNSTKINGEVGLSTHLSIKGSSEKIIPAMTFGANIEGNVSYLNLGKVPVLDAFIPNSGILDLKLQLSLASSILSIKSSSDSNIGYPDLSGETVVKNVYAPYRLDFRIRPMSGVDIAEVYSLIYNMIVSQSDILARENYNKIVEKIWKENKDNNIVLSIEALHEDNSIKRVVYKDYEIIDLIRKALGAM